MNRGPRAKQARDVHANCLAMNYRLASALALALSTFGVALQGGGCSYDWGYSPDGGAAEDASDVRQDLPPANDAATSDTGTGSPASCTSTATCGAGKYCKFADGHCGAEAAGTCTPRPSSCSEGGPGVICSCSGETYQSACHAALGGIDVAATTEGCTPPDTGFACGQFFCTAKFQYCVQSGDKAPQCVAYTTCTTATCDCPEYKELGCLCQGEPTRLFLKCP